MRYLSILFLLIIFNGCQEKEKYIYKYEKNGSIPISRTLVNTGMVEIFSNEYLIEREISGIEYAKEILNDDLLTKLSDDEFLKAVHEKFYKNLDFEEMKTKIYEKKSKIYEIKKEDYRWININDYEKQKKLYEDNLPKKLKY